MIFIIPKEAPRSSPHENHGKIMKFHDDQNSDFQYFPLKSKQIRIHILIGRGYVLQVLKLGQLQACLPIGGLQAPQKDDHNLETPRPAMIAFDFCGFHCFYNDFAVFSHLPLAAPDLCT